MGDDLLARAASQDKKMFIVEGVNHMSPYDAPKVGDEAASALTTLCKGRLAVNQHGDGARASRP